MKTYISLLEVYAELPEALCARCAGEHNHSTGRMRDGGARCVRIYCGEGRVGCIVVEGGTVHVVQGVGRLEFWKKARVMTEDLARDLFRAAGLH